jgi:hypothetical protein
LSSATSGSVSSQPQGPSSESSPASSASPASNPPAWATPSILAACKPGEKLYRDTAGVVRRYPKHQRWDDVDGWVHTEIDEDDCIYDRDESYTVPTPATCGCAIVCSKCCPVPTPAQACDGSGGFSSQSYDDRAQGMVGSYRPCPGCPACKPAKHDDGAEEVGIKAASDYFSGVTEPHIANKGYLASIITAAIRADRAARDPCNMTSVKVNMTREQAEAFAKESTGNITIMPDFNKHDDAAFREKVGTMCRVAIETTDFDRSVHILAREVLTMMEKP